jgi:hypothetical protein
MKRILRGRAMCTVVAVFAVAAEGRAQVPAGGEFRANTYTIGAQGAPATAREVDGDYVVVWHSLQDGDDFGIFGQRYDATGAQRGAEFRVNTYTTGRQYLPWVEADGTGRFVVVWTTYGASADGDGASVHARRFAADGSPLGDEFLVNTYTMGDQSAARVSVNRPGDFLIVWQSPQIVPGETEVMGQRFDRTGRRLGAEFRANNNVVPGNQVTPDVRLDNSGSFLVAWSGPDGSDSGIFAAAFDGLGQPFAEFRANLNTADAQTHPSLDRRRSLFGSLVIAWQSRSQDGSDEGVFARRYVAGFPQGPEFQVNTYTTGAQDLPVVTNDEGGNFTVTWRTAAPQDGSGDAVMGRRFFSSGLPRSPEFVVNTYTAGSQDAPNVGTDPNGNLVFTWRSFDQDGSDTGVFAQRYGGVHARVVAVDTAAGPTQDGNFVLDPGETVDLRPSWQNLTGASQALGGFLSNLSGPAGCTHGIPDAAGSYGAVANGATETCADCYAVSAGAGPRCIQHWDFRVIETLSPDAQGQVEEWVLHVGGSFADVPGSSAFYRFIETLLHHGVTGGCTGTAYCPTSSTTREQMAVFVLVAKEGAGYAPPPCATPVFNDVPASSGFCRWIEELARRGVVGGCGGGNYCPTTAATREQMAVFVLRTLDPALNPPACTTPMFADVPASSPFCRWIEELARRGVVSGCGGGNYCPTAAVTREQMSVFLAVTFGLNLYSV